VEVQKLVIDVLNLISVIKGGAGGSLRGRIVLGIASHTLNLAISRFEDKHFPGQRSDYVDPDGKMWDLMLELMPPHSLTIRVNQVFVTLYSLGDSHGDD
jgi:hypothetical protein